MRGWWHGCDSYWYSLLTSYRLITVAQAIVSDGSVPANWKQFKPKQPTEVMSLFDTDREEEEEKHWHSSIVLSRSSVLPIVTVKCVMWQAHSAGRNWFMINLLPLWSNINLFIQPWVTECWLHLTCCLVYLHITLPLPSLWPLVFIMWQWTFSVHTFKMTIVT